MFPNHSMTNEYQSTENFNLPIPSAHRTKLTLIIPQLVFTVLRADDSFNPHLNQSGLSPFSLFVVLATDQTTESLVYIYTSIGLYQGTG